MKAKIYTFRNLIFALFLMLTAITANSQGTIQTPMGQTISVLNNWDTAPLIAAWEAAAAAEISRNKWTTPNKLAPATSHYNCHSYAWNVVEGGSSTNTWINATVDGNPNLSKYWTNDAYISTSNTGNHEKIFYSSGDHSAVTTATAGIVTSKWGWWGLYQHAIAECVFNSSSLVYYKLVNPTISGSSEALCNNTQRTFSESSFTNISLNYDWSVIAPLTEVSGDGSSSYTVAGSAQSGSALVSLTITTPSGATSSSSKDVWSGEPLTPLFEAPQWINCDGLFYDIREDNNQQVSWEVTPPLYIYGSSFGKKCKVYASGNGFDGYVSITATAQNACGILSTVVNDIHVSCDELLLAPNPASNEVEVSLRSESTGQLQSELTTDKMFNIRIYNNQGNMVYNENRIGGKFKISTSNLKDGNYIVEMSFNNKTYNKQLIVKH
jgi:hypothetical protein